MIEKRTSNAALSTAEAKKPEHTETKPESVVNTTVSPDRSTIPEPELLAVAEGRHSDPHSVLGWHPNKTKSVVRVFRPLAAKVELLLGGEVFEFSHIAHGIWSAPANSADYLVRASYEDGSEWLTDDPYRFHPTISELDLHLIGEGRHEELWRVLGAHLRTLHSNDFDPTPSNTPCRGTAFTVLAPHAQAVRVVGNFNNWDGVGHAMRSMGATGVWELFIPGLDAGTIYKFDILSRNGTWLRRADPMANRAELAPATASIVFESNYQWNDTSWLNTRAKTNPHERPMSIYELHFGSWRPGLSYRSAADELIEYLQWLGYTHVEFMPLAEHPFGGSWGYQVTGYFAVTSRFGSPDDLKYLIDRLHQAHIGVIMDWVPGHFPKNEWALANFDGEPLFEHPDPRRGEQKDWGTLVFNFGNPKIRNFLVANALFWLEEMHVDGLRVDAVASILYLDYSRKDGEWLPNIYGGRENLEAVSFLQEASATAYKRNPGIVMIAEESTSWPGVTAPTSANGLGFGFKWNMGWMHDSLQYLKRDPVHRQYHHSELTFSFLYAFTEHFVLPISHDEVVHGKGSLLSRMPGDDWQKFAQLRAYLGFMWAHPGKKLLFMGQEFAQREEWNENQPLDWWLLEHDAHRNIAEFITILNQIYRSRSALWQLDDSPEGLQWVEGNATAESTVAFLRLARNDKPFLSVSNFSGIPQENFQIGLPKAGPWREVLNSDSKFYGGFGIGNLGQIEASATPYNNFPASATIVMPPLATIWFEPA